MDGERPGEFELIERYFRPLAADPGAFGLTDDAAVYTPPPGDDLVLTADLIAEGVHFFPDDPPAVDRRARRCGSISPISPPRARRRSAISCRWRLPADWTEDWIGGFAAGLGRRPGTLSASRCSAATPVAPPAALTVSITAFGRSPTGSIVRRRAPRPGDAIFVSGTIGDAALGLRLRLGTIDAMPAGKAADHLLDRYLHPQPRVALARCSAATPGAARHLRRPGRRPRPYLRGVRRRRRDRRRRGAAVGRQRGAGRRPMRPRLPRVLTGGDDYEILATVPRARRRGLRRGGGRGRRAGDPDRPRSSKGRGPPVVLGRRRPAAPSRPRQPRAFLTRAARSEAGL